jgi:hypothetical protein
VDLRFPIAGLTSVESGCERRRVNGAAKEVSSDEIRRIGIELARFLDGPAIDFSCMFMLSMSIME